MIFIHIFTFKIISLTERRRTIKRLITPTIIIILFLATLVGCSSSPASDTTAEKGANEVASSQGDQSDTSADIKDTSADDTVNNDMMEEDTGSEVEEEIVEVPQYSPVRIGTSVPEIQDVISLDNAADVIELADYGSIYVLPQVTDDGKYLFVASALGIDIYDTETYENIRHVDTKIRSDYRHGDMGISATGNYFYVIEEEALQVFSFEGERLLTLPPASSAAISPDGRIVAVSGENSFQIINVIDEQEVYSWDGNNETLHGEYPVFSMDGSTLATWFGKRLWLWDTANWQLIRDIWMESANNNQCSWTLSYDAGYLAVAHDDVVDIYNTETGVLVKTLEGFTTQELKANQVIFSPDGTTLAVLEPGNMVSLWVRSTGKRLSNFLQTSAQTVCLIKVTDEGDIIEYQLPEGEVTPWSGYRIPTNMYFSEDNSSLTFINTIIESKYGITGIEEICTLTFDGTPQCFRDYNLTLGSEGNYYTISTYKNNAYFSSYLPGGETEDISKFGIETKYSRVYLLGFVENENLLFYTNWNEVYGKGDTFAFDLEKRDMAKTYPDGFVRRVVFSDDFKYAAFFVQYENKVDLIVIDIESRTTIYKEAFDWCTRWCTILDFSSDNSTLVYSAGHGVSTDAEWFPISYVELKEPFEAQSIAYPHWPLMVELSPDSQVLAVALGGGTIALIDPLDGTVLNSWRAYHNQEISSLAFSHDGTLLASSSNNQDIKLWGVLPPGE